MFKNRLRISLAQMCSTNAHAGNVDEVRSLAARAAAESCDILCLPEAAGLMNRDVTSARAIIVDEREDPFVSNCQEMAARHGIWIHSGSTPVRTSTDRPANRTHLIDDTGTIVARYDKVHLFDVYLPDGVQRLESNRYTPGESAVVADTPWGPFGLSICYDLRFPHFYRDYAKAGARILFAPSAFTRMTGQAHWELLLRARAVENGAFVIAAAQTGTHDDGRQTYGHSMVVHPWGNVLLDLGEPVVSGILDLDLAEVETTRQQIPSLMNERTYRSKRVPSKSDLAQGVA
ncbi:MAG: carbon-nitrogen hydrolase family protein [Stappiaceae bacterium]